MRQALWRAGSVSDRSLIITPVAHAAGFSVLMKSYHDPPSPIHPRFMLPLLSPPPTQVALTFFAPKCRWFTGRFRGLHRSARRGGFFSLRQVGGWKHETYRGRDYGRVVALLCGRREGRGAHPGAGAAPAGKRVSDRGELRRLQFLQRLLRRTRRPVRLWREAAGMAKLSGVASRRTF